MKTKTPTMISARRYAIVLSAALIFFLLHRMPYVNLLITLPGVLCMLWLVCTVIWQIGARVQFWMALVTWVVAFILVLFSYDHAAEVAGNMVYYLVTLGVLRLMQGLLRKR